MSLRETILFVALLSGCTSETTIVLTVDGDLRPGEGVDAVEAFLWHEGEQTLAVGRRLTSFDSLPLTFRMTPPKEGAATVDVTVTANAGGEVVVEARREVSFERGTEEDVRFCLWARCADDPELLGCAEGRCDVPESDADGDADADADGDGDADVDGDSDADGDADGDLDGGRDSDVPRDAEGDGDSDAEPLLCDDLDEDGVPDAPGPFGDVLSLTLSLRAGPFSYWNNGAYGAAWVDDAGGDSPTVMFRSMSAEGAFASDAAVVGDGASEARFVAVAGDGSNYAVAWSEDRGDGFELAFAIVSAAGERVGDVVTITDGLADVAGSALAWNGTEYGVVFICDYDPSSFLGKICFTRVTSGGAPAGSIVEVATSNIYLGRLYLRWTGTEYILIHTADCPATILRLDASGETIGARNIVYCSPEAGRYVQNTCPANVVPVWTGEEHLLALACSGVDGWVTHNEMQLLRLDDEGAPLSAIVGVPEAGVDAIGPHMAWNGTEALLGWTDGRSGWSQAAAISPSGEISRPFVVALGTLRGVVSGDGDFAATWDRIGSSFARVNVCR